MPAKLLADILLVVHAAVIAFVAGGLILTLIGAALRWQWVRNRWFRLTHLACVVVITFQQWQRIPCPLTVWEHELRRAAGQEGYDNGFLATWIHPLIFFDLPHGAFDVAYATFALLVILALWAAPIRWRKSTPARTLEPDHASEHP